MKKLLKVFSYIGGTLILVAAIGLVYLNFVYLPQKVKAQGPALLQKKSQGRIQAQSIQYIPFKGVELKNVVLFSPTKEPILKISKIDFVFRLWPLLVRREIVFRTDVYPAQMKKPIVFSGLYQIKQEKLDADFKLISELFSSEEIILGKLSALARRGKNPAIDLGLHSAHLNLQGKFLLDGQDLRMEKFSGQILQSSFDFIGDVQNLAKPSLNIYGNFDLNLAGLQDLNPKYLKVLQGVQMAGHCLGEIFISEELASPHIGLKMNAAQVIRIKNIPVEDVAIVAEMKDKKARLNKFYAKLCGGEINLQGECEPYSPGLPAQLNINIFNLSLQEAVRETLEKKYPVSGRVFTLGRLEAPLKNPKAVEGKIWFSAAGTDLLQLPLFKGLTEVLGLPELQKLAFKEASGNFFIAQETIKTDDFKITSANLALYFKGNMDFKGNLGFDIQPTFSQDFLISRPNIRSVLGVFMDSAGNFLGEIKLKGSLKSPRYTFKPISVDKVFRRGLEEGLKQLFKFKKQEE